LALKKPVNAREMSISLIGEQMMTNTQDVTRQGLIMGDGARSQGAMMPMMHRRRGREGIMVGTRSEKSTMTECVRVYDFKQQLDTEKEYSPGQEYYFFEIKIPADILDMRPQTTGPVQSYPIKWYLLAKLDIPGRPDIRKRVDVTVG
jgi:hypothetical protein